MSKLIYEVVQHVGLPPGHLGPGMPSALYAGSRVGESRIQEFLPRLVSLGSVKVAGDQDGGERILLEPNSDASAVAQSPDSDADAPPAPEPKPSRGKRRSDPDPDLDLSDVQGVTND